MTKAEQIEAILGSNESALAKKYFEGDRDRLEASWSISKQDVVDYIEANGFPRGWVSFERDVYDGVSLVRNNDVWELSYQDSGKVLSREEFQDRGEAISSLLDTYYLKSRKIR